MLNAAFEPIRMVEGERDHLNVTPPDTKQGSELPRGAIEVSVES